MDQCDVVVSQVTMAMHIAIGLGKRLILMNNIFNRNEFFIMHHVELMLAVSITNSTSGIRSVISFTATSAPPIKGR